MAIRLMGKEKNFYKPISLREALNQYFCPGIIKQTIKFNNQNDILFDDFENKIEEYNRRCKENNNDNEN